MIISAWSIYFENVSFLIKQVAVESHPMKYFIFSFRVILCIFLGLPPVDKSDLEIVVYPGILVPRIYLSLQNIFKEFSELGPLLNILLSRFKFLQIFFDISADLTVYSADLPIFSADLLIISENFS